MPRLVPELVCRRFGLLGLASRYKAVVEELEELGPERGSDPEPSKSFLVKPGIEEEPRRLLNREHLGRICFSKYFRSRFTVIRGETVNYPFPPIMF